MAQWRKSSPKREDLRHFLAAAFTVFEIGGLYFNRVAGV
jgi:hypothetical protein